MTVFAWDITAQCNFGCPYCCYPVVRQGASDSVPAERLQKAWEWVYDTYGSSLIHLTGGEPFAYPDFVDLVAGISRFHRLHITTNLSLPLEQFIARADPEKTALNATFHPLYIAPEIFKNGLLCLRNAGFSCSVCYLAHPCQLREMLHYKRYFLAHGINMTVTPFWGVWNGRVYPQAYTVQECCLIEQETHHMDGCGRKIPPGEIVKPDNLPGKIVPEPSGGTLCHAGCTYAAIGQDGVVRRCGQSESGSLGNLYDRTMRLTAVPSPCTAVFCRSREFRYTR